MNQSDGRQKQSRLQQLRGFCRAAREGSISRAAEKLQLSQPTVSLQIKALEEELDAKLFRRRGPRIELTYDGRQLLELARPLVDAIDRLPKEFSARRESPDRGTINIAAGGSTLQYILPPFVERFTREHPNVDVRLHNVPGKGGLALLRDGGADFAVGPMLDAPTDIEFIPLFSFEPMLITRLDHPLAAKKRIGLKDLSRYPLVLPPKDQSTFRIVEAVFVEHGLDYDVKLEVGGYEVIKEYVRLGLGISIVMSHCLAAHDQLYSASVSRYFHKREYGVVRSKNRRTPAAAEGFIATLRAGAKASK